MLIMIAFEGLKGKIIDESDYGQLSSVSDQLYIDYNFMNKVITIHLEHYTGIFLLSDEATQQELENIWGVIKPNVATNDGEVRAEINSMIKKIKLYGG
ncbi:MAG: hypothetical protein AAF195_03940, partial [Pseudomonadota bacterium]